MLRALSILMLSALLLSCEQATTAFGESDNASFASSIYGQVTDRSGAALQGVVVKLTSSVSDTTDAGGGYRFDNVASGGYRLQLVHADYLVRTDSVNLNLAQSLDLGRQEMRLRYGSLNVSVKDAKGVFVAGAKVVVIGQDTAKVTDSAGKIFFPRVEPGMTRVLAIKEDIGYALRDTIATSEDTIANLAFSLTSRGGTISGTIQDLLHRPMAGVRIQTLGGGLQCTSDVQGRFLFPMVPTELPLTVNIDSGSQHQAIVGVRVEPGKNTDLDTIAIHGVVSSALNILQDAIVYAQVSDTTLAVTVGSVPTEKTPKILWYSWNLDGAFKSDTSSVPRYNLHPVAAGWNVGTHDLKCRAIFKDGTSSNVASIQVKVMPFQGYSITRNSDSLWYVNAAWITGARVMPHADYVYLYWQIDSGSMHLSIRDSSLFGLGHKVLGKRFPKGARVRLAMAGKNFTDAPMQWRWSAQADIRTDSMTSDSLFLDMVGYPASHPARPRFDANFPQSKISDTQTIVRVRQDSLTAGNCLVKYTLDGALPDTSSKNYDVQSGIAVRAPSDTSRPVVVTVRSVVDLLGLGLWSGDTVIGRVWFGKPKGIRHDTLLKTIQVTGKLVPAFKPGILTYTDTLDWNATSESILAAGDTLANVSGVGAIDLSALPAGSTMEWPLIVTNGPESLRYTLNLFKRPKPITVSDDASLQSLSISSGALSPAFVADSISYSDTIAWDAKSVTIVATPRDPSASVVGTGVVDLSSVDPGQAKVVAVQVINGSKFAQYDIVIVKSAKPTVVIGQTN
jgi:Carboxypeptidase regulatory-like domain